MITKKKDREKQAREMVNWLNNAFEAYPKIVGGRYKLVDMLPGKKMIVAILCFLVSAVFEMGLCSYANFSPHNTGVISVLTVVGILLGAVVFAWSTFLMFWCTFQPISTSLMFTYSKRDLDELARICRETSLKIEAHRSESHQKEAS